MDPIQWWRYLLPPNLLISFDTYHLTDSRLSANMCIIFCVEEQRYMQMQHHATTDRVSPNHDSLSWRVLNPMIIPKMSICCDVIIFVASTTTRHSYTLTKFNQCICTVSELDCCFHPMLTRFPSDRIWSLIAATSSAGRAGRPGGSFRAMSTCVVSYLPASITLIYISPV